MRSKALFVALHRAARDWGAALRTCIPIYLIDLRATNRRFWLGPMWVVLPLLLVLLIGAGLGTHRWAGQMPGVAVPYPLYVVTGLAFWQIFAEAALMPLRRMTGFKRELIRGLMTVEQVIAVGLVDLLLMAILRLALVLGIVAAFGLSPSTGLATLPVVLAAIVGAGLIIGMLAALPGLLVEDIGRALAVLLTIGMLASPVFYPVHELGFSGFSPLAGLIDAARSSVTGQGMNLSTTLPWLVVELVLLAAVLLFIRRSKHRFLGALA